MPGCICNAYASTPVFVFALAAASVFCIWLFVFGFLRVCMYLPLLLSMLLRVSFVHVYMGLGRWGE